MDSWLAPSGGHDTNQATNQRYSGAGAAETGEICHASEEDEARETGTVSVASHVTASRYALFGRASSVIIRLRAGTSAFVTLRSQTRKNHRSFSRYDYPTVSQQGWLHRQVYSAQPFVGHGSSGEQGDQSGGIGVYNVFDRKDVECGKIIDPAYANLPRPECFSRSRDQLSALLFRLIMIDQSAYDS